MPTPATQETTEEDHHGWCHSCASTVELILNEGTMEFECLLCKGNFVELNGQDIESFTSVVHSRNDSGIETQGVETYMNASAGENENGGYIGSDGSSIRSSLENDDSYVGSHSGGAESSTQISQIGTSDVMNRILNRVLRSRGLQATSPPGASRSIAVILQGTHSPTLASINPTDGREGDSPVDLINSFLTTATNATTASNGSATTGEQSNFLSRSLLSLAALGNTLAGGIPDANYFSDLGSNRGLENLLHHLMMNENSHPSTPVTPEAIKKLTRVNIKEDTDLVKECGCLDNSCGITLDPLEEGEVAIVLDCKHVYKEESILEWFKQHNTCPVCRKSVELEEGDNEDSVGGDEENIRESS